MPYQGYMDGLYLVKQRSQTKVVDHYGILDIGNRLRHPHADGINPTVLHQTPPQVRIDWFQDTGTWEVLGQITDEAMAMNRLAQAAQNPNYDLFGNNCEHFARFVASGKRESTQLRAAAIATGLGVLTVLALRS